MFLRSLPRIVHLAVSRDANSVTHSPPWRSISRAPCVRPSAANHPKCELSRSFACRVSDHELARAMSRTEIIAGSPPYPATQARERQWNTIRRNPRNSVPTSLLQIPRERRLASIVLLGTTSTSDRLVVSESAGPFAFDETQFCDASTVDRARPVPIFSD